MITKDFYIYLAGFIFLLSGSALACQPPMHLSYTLELEDGEHVFAMKSHPNADYDYPFSGLYRKGSEKELTWAYDGRFIEQENFQNQISRDGRYMVVIHSPSVDRHPSLSIYHHGKVIHELNSEHFLDYPEQTREQICDLPFWGFNGQYDKLNDVFSVETTGKRRVSIHVPTGDIIQTESILRLRIDAETTRKDNSLVLVQSIGHCDYEHSNVIMFVFRKEDGLTDSPLIQAHESGFMKK